MLHEILDAVAAPVAMLTRGAADGGLVIEAANGRLASLLGSTPAALAGQPALLVLPASLGVGPEGGKSEVALGPGALPHRAVVRALPDGPGGRPRCLVTFLPYLESSLGAVTLGVLDLQSEMISQWRPDGTIVYANQAFARQCGRSRAEVIGARLHDLTPPDEMALILQNIARLSAARPTAAYDHPLVGRDDGEERWQAWIDQAILGEDGRITGYLSVGRDITARKTAERRLADSEQRLKLALEAGGLGVWESDLATDRVRLDPICLTRLGWDAEPCERPLAEVVTLIHPRDRARVRGLYGRCRRGELPQIRLEYRVRRRDGSHAWIEEHAIVAERGSDGRPRRLVGVSADITPRKEAEMRLAHLALHDPLTGLPNRRALAESLDRAIARAGRTGQPVAVLALDLDGFKAVNDRHGHAAGDVVLVEVAARLRRVVRRSDIVARLGGDEFAVIAGELNGPAPVARLARRIATALAEPVAVTAAARIGIGVGIGVAFFPGDGETPEEILARADAALYAAKRGRAGCRFTADLRAPAAGS
jgi:diguanylate cyclase (GGDEF)-like protein/PAS domain S-box-containing protein